MILMVSLYFTSSRGQLPMTGVHILYLWSVVRELTVEELLLLLVLSELMGV